MRKFRKKRGSTFIIVVFVTAIIFTTATTMIAVVTNDYKMRINESNKVENLYEADSGLDAVYNVIAKDSDMAVLYASNEVKATATAHGATNQSYSDSAINNDYKTAFYNFLSRGLSNTLDEIVAADTINDSQIPADSSINTSTARLLVYSILNLKYFDKPQITNPTNADLATMSNYRFNIDAKNQNSINLGDQNRTIKITSITLDPTNQKITVGLSSTFKTDTTKGTGYANTKTVETKYTIIAPEYDKSINRETNANAVPIYAVQRALVADGDINIKDGVNATVTTKNSSDLAVWAGGIHYDTYKADDYKTGKYNTTLGYAYDKYKYGISIDNNSSLDVTGNVSTNETFNLGNNANANLRNNLYAKNAYLGELNGSTSTNNYLSVINSLITNNDLTVNTTNSSVNLKNYYGISDRNEADTNAYNDAEKSSSILINNVGGNKVKAESAYVSGLAYIDTQDSNGAYQTGESVAVKGNQVAYTTTLPGSTNTVTVNPSSKFLEFGDKAGQFYDYFNQTKDAQNGGVEIDNLYSVGASVNKDTVTAGTTVSKNKWSTSNSDAISSQRTDFTTNVFRLGDKLKGTASDNDVKVNNPGNMLTVGHQNNQIRFDKINKNYIEDRASYKNYGQLVLATKANRKGSTPGMTISGTQITYDGHTYNLGNSSGELEAIIVTDEDITITGNTTFKGSIITKGNITIQGDNTGGASTKNVSINFDPEQVQKIIGQYADTTKISGPDLEIHNILNGTTTDQDLFVGDPIYTYSTTTITTSNYVNLSSDSQIYDSNKYLKKGLWKLLKETGEVIDQK